MAGAVLLEISKDEDERAKLMSRKKYEMDMTSNRLERDATVKKEMAKKLKLMAVLSNEQIAQASELPIAEVEEL